MRSCIFAFTLAGIGALAPSAHADSLRSAPVATIARDSGAVFRLQRLADGVYFAEVLPDAAAYAFANSLVVIGGDGVLVVDTQQSLTAARALIREIRGLTAAPVRWVVNTHWHGDHVLGNAAYRDAFPGVRFVGHASLPADLDGLTRPRLDRDRVDVPRQLEARRQWLATGIGPAGAALSDAERRTVERGVRLREGYLADLADLELIPPDETFERERLLDVGGRSVRLLAFGEAHTRADVIVQLPDDGIVLASDLVEEALPFFGDGYPSGWLGVLDSLDALPFTTLLPSHGSVQRDRTLIAEARALLAAIVTHTRAACTDGAEEAAVAALGKDPRVTAIAERYRTTGPALEQYLARTVARAWQECGRPPGR